MIWQLLLRELRLVRRQAFGTLLSLTFFALFIMMSGLALDGIAPSLAPGLVWLAVTFSALLSLDNLFQSDQECGALRHIHLAGVSGTTIVTAKSVAFFLTNSIPLILVTVGLSPLLGLSGDALTGLILSLLLGLPALTAYATLSAALLCGQRGTGLLGLIITLPLLVPIVLFGIEAAQSYPIDGIAALQFRILAGLSCISIALGVPASVAALAINRGPS